MPNKHNNNITLFLHKIRKLTNDYPRLSVKAVCAISKERKLCEGVHCTGCPLKVCKALLDLVPEVS